MFLEIVLSVFMIGIVKACFSVNWITAKQATYSRPGPFYSIKKWIFYFAYRIRRFWYIREREKLDGINLACAWEKQDCVQPLFHHADAADIIEFTAMAESGVGVAEDTVIVARITRRPDYQAELALYVQVPGHGFMQLPGHPDTIVCDASSEEESVYKADGVVIEVKEPMRQWRLSYHGMMRMVDTSKESSRWSDGKNLIYVKFGFAWTAYASPFCPNQQTAPELISEAAAREFWTFNFFSKLESFSRQHSHYEQWGQLRGSLYVDGMEEGSVGRELTLRGVRSHSFGLHSCNTYHRYMRITAHLRDGLSLGIIAASINGHLTHVLSGYVVEPDRRLYPITWSDLRLWQHGENGEIPDIIQFNVASEIHKCNVVCLIRLKPEIHNGLDWKAKTHHCLADIYVNSKPGRGAVELFYRTPTVVCPIERTRDPSPFAIKFPSTDTNKLTLCLADQSCQNTCLTGGAASQLACLKALTSNRNVGEFYVAEGFCITSHASEAHLEINPELRQHVDNMVKLSRCENDDELRDACSRCYTAFLASAIPDSLVAEITDRVRKLASLTRHFCAQVVVRSSIVGEVGDEQSELQIIPNVTGMKQIVGSILKCWANRCGFDVIQCRRQKGLPVFPPMGVVVQAVLEDARSTGYVTTCDPHSGDPSVMLINANYVMTKVTTVDQSQPDRIVLRRCDDDSFRVISQTIGLKQKITHHDTKTSSRSGRVSIDYVQECSLSFDNVMRLAELADDIKCIFKNDREIHWTTARGKIFLTRCCEMKQDPTESYFETMHEFDSASAFDDTWIASSKNNDFLPDPATPLTLSTIVREIAKGFQQMEIGLPDGGGSGFPESIASVSCGRTLVNLHDLLPPSSLTQLFGVDIDQLRLKVDEDVLHEYHNFESSILMNFKKRISAFLKHLRGARSDVAEMSRQHNKLASSELNSHELHQLIGAKLLPTIRHTTKDHMICCKIFLIWKQLLQFVLSGSRDPASWSDYSLDVTFLLAPSVCDETKAVPELLHGIAEAIRDAGFKEEFVAMKPGKAVEWLESQDDVQLKKLYQKLLDNHGHRCLSELELREESWSEDPTKLVTVLQAVVDCCPARKSLPVDDVDAAILRLHSPLNSLQRSLLKLMMPWTRRALRGREESKSRQIKNIEAVKRAYRKLAKMLKREGLLPDDDLLFFLTHWEIGKLIQFKSSVSLLVARAIDRRHFFSRQKCLSFSDVNEGQLLEPATDVQSSTESIPFNTVLHGLPVCAGKIRAPVRIVSDQSEAFLIQAGEILIVQKPEIGWSSYYPLLSGLITEVGQVSSHGALLAASYNLPCVVNVKQATKCFKTGDIVWLNGGSGTVQRASPRLNREQSALLLA